MNTELRVYIVIVVLKEKNVLLQQTGDDIFKLPSSTVDFSESVMTAAARAMRTLYISGTTQFKNVIGVYELTDLDEKKKIVAVGVGALCSKLSPQTNGRLYEHTAIEAYIEDEKALEDPSFAAKILDDYLKGKSYPLELLNVVEERKI